MNNSLTRVPEQFETQVRISQEDSLKKLEAKTLRIIQAVEGLEKSQDFRTLKTEVFEGISERLTRELLEESKKENPNTNKLSRIAGELKWAERFADLPKFKESQRVELTRIRTQLHGKTETRE